MNHHGDVATAALQIARASQFEYNEYQHMLGEIMAQMSHAYGDASGVAHAAEISAEQIAEFAEYWTTGQLSLPPRPPFTSRFRDAPAPRRTWTREPFEYFSGLDDRNDPETPAAPSNAPGGDPGQGSSRRDTRDRRGSPSDNGSGDENGEYEGQDSNHGPDS